MGKEYVKIDGVIQSSFTMIRFLPLVFLVSALGLRGEHGSTQDFEERSVLARKLLAGVLPSEQVKVLWAKEAEGWSVSVGDGKEGTLWGEIREGVFIRGEGAGKAKWQKSLRDKKLSGKRGPEPKAKELGASFELVGETVFVLNEHSFELPEGWIWKSEPLASPNGQWCCLQKERDVRLRQVHYTRSSPQVQLQPKHFINTYSKPGDELRTRVPVLLGVDGQRVEVASELIENPYSISNVHWRSEDCLWFEYIERGFGKFRLLELNATTGKTRVVAEEVSDKFVHVFEKCGWWDLGGGMLLWRSESDGWSHLFLVDEETGERKQLTQGEWVVRGVSRVEGDEVFLELSGFFPEQDPYYLHYARLDWKTGEMTMLTHGDGAHVLEWAPDRSYYVDRFSRVDMPPVLELRSGESGSLLAELGRATREELKKMKPYLPERFVTTDREGRHEIHGVIWKPKNFDPAKTYPVIENIYAGPHGAFVPKQWRRWHGHRSEMADAGFVVVQIDGRGTNYRGREFQQYAYKNIKDSGFPDRIKWMKEAAKSRPWMDLERVGLYGGSAGGQSTLAGLLWHGGFYKAGAADCGCHDNRMDKIWWNEQWMDWPIDESYRANSNSEHVSQLQGDLFLTVGEVDTNVDPSSTYQVVDALIRADKDFEFYMVPNGGHGIGESPYLRRKRVEFFQRILGD